ncbi:MAG: Rid family hydrolase [Pirellula sp.]|nr:Rid family hydrolase [Pirellula sp.]
MQTPIRFGVTKRWSDAVVVGNLGFFVEVPDNPDDSPIAQFQAVLHQTAARCAEIGTSHDQLVQVLVYLPYAEDLALFNELWDNWLPHGSAPTRACTHPPLADSRYRVELVVTVFVPTKT